MFLYADGAEKSYFDLIIGWTQVRILPSFVWREVAQWWSTITLFAYSSAFFYFDG